MPFNVPHVLQVHVPQPAFGPGAHNMPTAVTAPPQTTLAMAVANRVNRNKCARPPLYMLCQKPLQDDHIVTHDIYQVQPATKGLYVNPKLPIIKEALDKLVNRAQLIRVNKPTPWISNMVVCEHPASVTNPAKVCICQDPSQTINKAII